MFQVLRRLFLVMPRPLQRRFAFAQVFFLFLAVLEVSSVVSIAPFIALVINIDVVHTNEHVAWLYAFSGAETELEFLYYVAAAFVMLFFFNGVMQLYAEAARISFSRNLEVIWISRLLKNFLGMVGARQSASSQDTYFSQLNTEVTRCCSEIALPILEISSRVIAIVLLVGLLLFVNFTGALLIFFGIGSVYISIFYLAGPRVKRNGVAIADLNRKRLALFVDAVQGRNDIWLYRLVDSVVDAVRDTVQAGVAFHQRQGIIRDLPYHAVEFTAFSLIVVVILYTFNHASSVEEAVTRLSVLCLAGYRLIPKFQKIYRSLARIKGMQAAFFGVCDGLMFDVEGQRNGVARAKVSHSKGSSWYSLKNICFLYDDGKDILNDVSLSISRGEFVGLVGESGAGKTTLSNIVLGFLQPTAGEIVTSEDDSYFADRVFFVSSETHIFRGTIKYNITFDRCVSELDEAHLEKVIRCVGLQDVLDSKEHGIDAEVSYNGNDYSSGQIQRIGFARALFQSPVLLVLDEATNALNFELQQSIIGNIRNEYKDLAMLGISHRLDMQRNFDKCYRLSDGKLVLL